MNGRSRAVPEWQESKIAVRRTPGWRGFTLRGGTGVREAKENWI
jgi:hypothetical protein